MLKVHAFSVGGCYHPEKIVYPSGSLKKRFFPSHSYLITHEKHGHILFDTGYSQHFFKQTKYFPEKFYALLTPVVLPPEEFLAYQLKEVGLKTSDIAHIIVSHFHADHMAGIGDFENADYHFMKSGLDTLKSRSRLGQVKSGFLAGLLPSWTEEKTNPLEARELVAIDGLGPFTHGRDLFNDGSIWAIDLPGHHPGHIGLYMPDTDQGRIFLVADAYWACEALKIDQPPMKVASLISENWNEYLSTFHQVASLDKSQKELRVIACHCNRNDELKCKK